MGIRSNSVIKKKISNKALTLSLLYNLYQVLNAVIHMVTFYEISFYIAVKQTHIQTFPCGHLY